MKDPIQQGSVEEAWKTIKECMLVSATRECGIERRRNVEMRRKRWWNDKVRCAVSSKLTYKLMFNVGRGEARQRYT